MRDMPGDADLWFACPGRKKVLKNKNLLKEKITSPIIHTEYLFPSRTG